MFEKLHRAPSARLAIDDSKTGAFRSQDDILGHGKVWAERKLLVDQRDSVAPRFQRRVRCVSLTEQSHRSIVRTEPSGKDVHQCALARPILADQRVDLSRPHGQIDTPEGECRAEALRYALKMERCFRGSGLRRIGHSFAFPRINASDCAILGALR